MADGIINLKQTSNYLKAQIEWYTEGSSLIANLQICGSNGHSGTRGTWHPSITLNGSVIASDDVYETLQPSGNWTTILTAKATLSGPSTLGGYVSAPSGTSLVGQSCSGSGTITPDTPTVTPKATTPVLGKGTTEDTAVELGGVIDVTLNPNVDSLTHTLFYRVTGLDDMPMWENLAGGTWWWTLSYHMAYAFPTMTRGTGQLICRTYQGDTLIGETSVGYYYIVPDNDTTKPKIQSCTLEPYEPAGVSLPDKLKGIFIQNVTQIKGEIAAEQAFSPIRSYRLAGNGISSEDRTSSPAYGWAEYSGSLTVLGRVTDNRGFYRDSPVEIYVFDYRDPYAAPVNGGRVICGRCNASGSLDENGLYLKIEARKVCSGVFRDGWAHNTCRMDYRIRHNGGGRDYGEWVSLSGNSDGDVVSYRSENAMLALKNSYSVEIRVTDDVGRSGSLITSISSDFVTLHLAKGGRGAAFFKRAERDRCLEVDGDIAVTAERTIQIGDVTLTKDGLTALLALIE